MRTLKDFEKEGFIEETSQAENPPENFRALQK